MTRDIKIATIAVLGTLGVSALIANAQLGPLDPPAGPVVDTGPSLAELLTQLPGTPTQPLRVSSIDASPGSSVTIFSDDVFLQRVTVQRGSFRLTDSTGASLELLAGAEQVVTDAFRFREPFTHELGIQLFGPVTVDMLDVQSGASANFFFVELP